jgi:hypothetical protein
MIRLPIALFVGQDSLGYLTVGRAPINVGLQSLLNPLRLLFVHLRRYTVTMEFF